jgi:hypothetical protein
MSRSAASINVSRLSLDASALLERTAMRNFGLVPRSTSFDVAAPKVQVKTHGIAILVVSAVVLIGLPMAIYALVVGFG